MDQEDRHTSGGSNRWPEPQVCQVRGGGSRDSPPTQSYGVALGGVCRRCGLQPAPLALVRILRASQRPQLDPFPLESSYRELCGPQPCTLTDAAPTGFPHSPCMNRSYVASSGRQPASVLPEVNIPGAFGFICYFTLGKKGRG